MTVFLLKKPIAVFLAFLSAGLYGQENLPFSNDIFSGINSVPFSPAQAFLNPNPWDVNLVSAGVSVENDYAYISDRSFLALIKNEVFARDTQNNITGENTPGILDFFNKDLSNAHVNSDLLGPSFTLRSKIKGKLFQFGLFTRLRTQVSAVDVDNYLKFENQSMPDPETFILKPFQANAMNWGEIAFNVATEILPYSARQWIIGANLKYEVGFDAATAVNFSSAKLSGSVEEVDGDERETLILSDFNFGASYATNYDSDAQRYDLRKRGQGLGLDFGISMIDKQEGAESYNLKAGISVLDLGTVRFNGEKHLFKGDNLVIINNPNLNNVEFENPGQYLKLLSSEVYGDENASLQSSFFNVGLPTSLHFNLSKNIVKDQYLNFDLIQRTPVFENSLKRSNIFNVSYTNQKPFMGYGGSVSLYEYQNIRFGGYLRIGPLILGSSNIFPLFFKQKKLNSGDFFIGLKLYHFWDNEFKRHRRADCNCD